MPEAASKQKIFLNAIKNNIAKGVDKKEILVFTKEKGVLTVTAESMSWNGNQKYRLAPEARAHYGKLEKLAEKKALGELPKKKVVAAVKKNAATKKKVSAKKVDGKKKGKVAKKVASKSNISVLKKAKRSKVAASKKVKKSTK